MPDAKLRRRHWQRVCGEDSLSELDRISERFRLTGGNISRAAGLAQSYAALRGRAGITLTDAQQATRALNRQILDTLAVRLQSLGDWNQLAVGDQTRQELQALESRCRYREQLCDVAGTQLNPGVRALFSGPSGTGKTLAARLLASVLQMDLYRLDLSAVVNKYIGETEKNLNQVFSRAEELDVILLLDEGDALLTQRTGVQSSNDRYANLETNYLLQRVESFEGILIVTTNAGDRIDTAFQRRMDVVISFPSPDALGRWAIWQLHLPLDHAVDPLFLEEVAGRCTLNGGQIRNAALQASLLALDDGGIVTSAQLETSIQREYRKVGAVCPLRGI
jgi:SpoVK/Ycf46/Vps4 family AAA+-type ATPase